VFVATIGCTWRQLPPIFGASWQAVHRRFAEWSDARVWAKLYRILLDELGSRGQLDWSRLRNRLRQRARRQRGDLTGPNPVDRGKNGSKIHVITERTGLPISVAISAANTHDEYHAKYHAENQDGRCSPRIRCRLRRLAG
jgi:transposase